MARRQLRQVSDDNKSGADAHYAGVRSRAHEYHASDDSGADNDGDLIFNWTSPLSNSECIPRSEKMVRHKIATALHLS